jgi:hypothetical protein
VPAQVERFADPEPGEHERREQRAALPLAGARLAVELAGAV